MIAISQHRWFLGLIALGMILSQTIANAGRRLPNFDRWDYSVFVGPDPSVQATPVAINGNGAIAGYYFDPLTQRVQSFFQNKRGRNRIFDVNLNNGGPASAFPIGIDNRGNIVGFYDDASQVQRSFYWNGTTAVDLAAPGFISSAATSMSSDGRVLLACSRADFSRAYVVWKNGVFSEVPAVPDFEDVEFYSINDDGDLLGVGYDAGYTTRTFFTRSRRNGSVTILPVDSTPFTQTEYLQLADDGKTMGYTYNELIQDPIVGNPPQAFIARNNNFAFINHPNQSLGTRVFSFNANFMVGLYYEEDGDFVYFIGER
jgi:uncharacterized membrane protein